MFKNTLLVMALAIPSFSGAVYAQSAQEVTLIKSVFNQLQSHSIRENREFCGYLGLDVDGNLVASQPTRGGNGSCQADEPENIEVPIASYHTHGAFSRDYASETPSVADMEGDEAEGIDGWVATPGGRLWHVDTEAMDIRQVCGVGCLQKDPNFDDSDMADVRQHYTYDELVTYMEDQ